MMYELVGYLASAFLAMSLVVTNAYKFRWLSTGGQISFIVYGILIGAWPIIIANGVLLCINLYQIVQLYKYQETFQLAEMHADNHMVQLFLSYYKKDIHDYFPNFALNYGTNTVCLVVLRDMAMANLFIAQVQPNGVAMVDINFTVARYRDFKVGKFLFGKEREFLLQKGIHQLVYTAVSNKGHLNFLQAMGFEQKTVDGQLCWIKNIA